MRYGMLILSLLGSLGICLGTDSFASLNWLWLLPLCFVGCFVAIFVLAFLVLWIMCLIVDTEKPQEKDSRFYRWVTQSFAQLAMWVLLIRVHKEGMEKLPKKGRYLLVCNHINDLDPVTLLAYFPRSQLAFISKRENDSMFLVGKLMHKLMCQLINRENDREALRTIITCIDLLKKDMVSVAVFPEGYTSMDGLLHPFRSGVFKIAQKANVPIVVCTVQNTNKVFKNVKRLRPTHVHLHLLDVIWPEDYAGMTTVDISSKVHTMMAEDLGPALVLQENP